MARPKRPRYDESMDEQAYRLCLLRFMDKDLADFFGISERTLNRWKRAHPSFGQAIKKGKTIIDGDVAASLVQKALGYWMPEDKVFPNGGAPFVVRTQRYYPADTMAIMYLLNNRQPEHFRQTRNDTNPEDASLIAQALAEVAKRLPV